LLAKVARAALYAKGTARRLAISQARKAGADHVKVVVRHSDERVGGDGGAVFLGTEITATAAGRPRLKERQSV